MHRVEPVVRDDGLARRRGVAGAGPASPRAGRRDRRRSGGRRPPRSSAWFSSSRFSASVTRISGAAAAIAWSKSATSCATVIAGSVAGSTVRGTPSSISVVSGTTSPRAGVPAATTPTPRTSTAATVSPMPGRAPRTIPAPAPPPSTSRVANRREVVGRRARLGQQPVEERPGGAHDDQAREEADLGAELVGLRRHQQRARHGHEEPEHDPPDPPGRHGLRVGDHEEQEDHAPPAR